MTIKPLKIRLEKIKTGLEKKITEISIKKFSLRNFSLSWDNILTLALILISILYGFIVRIRVLFYRQKFLKTRKLPCIVISIGNITIGGSGKTPMAIYLAETIKKAGLKPVVLSRGYKSRMENGMGVAGNGSIVLATPKDVGDEPYMMAKRCSFPVVVGKNRFKAGIMAVKLFNPDIIILDDGFQHIQLHRDIDILLLDYNKPFGNGKLLPAGRLRELPDEIKKRADVVIFTRCPFKYYGHDHKADDRYSAPHRLSTMYEKPAMDPKVFHMINDKEKDKKNMEDRDITYMDKCTMIEPHNKINHMRKPCFYTCHKPFLFLFKKYVNISLSAAHDDLSTLNTPNGYNLDKFTGKNAILFSGIADNSTFRRTIENLNIHVKDHLEFMDHYRYNRHDINAIIKRGKASGADLIMTTEKDYARLCNDIDWKMDMAVIGIEIDWSVNGKQYEAVFFNFIKKQILSISPGMQHGSKFKGNKI